jgi:hypothetical protein
VPPGECPGGGRSNGWRLVRATARNGKAQAWAKGPPASSAINLARSIAVHTWAALATHLSKPVPLQRLTGNHSGLATDPTVGTGGTKMRPSSTTENSCACLHTRTTTLRGKRGKGQWPIYRGNTRPGCRMSGSARRAGSPIMSLKGQWANARIARNRPSYTYSPRVRPYFAIFSFSVRRGRHSSSITDTMLPLCRRIVLSISMRSNAST